MPRRLFRRRPATDPTLNPTRIMQALADDQRRQLAEEMRRKASDPGPCASCDAPTTHLRPLFIPEPDAQLFGQPPGHWFLIVGYFCPAHDTEADASRFRADLVREARHRPVGSIPTI